jgi:hypothetical protein
MNEVQRAKDKLKFELDNLKNGLFLNLNCKEKDIEYKTHYSDTTYNTVFTINYVDSTKSRAYKNFEITGEYFPYISNFEYNGEKFAFIISSLKFIEKVKDVLRRLDASW